MAFNASEKEQIDMIKDWWRENGKFTIYSVIAAVVLSLGWRYWQNSKNQDTAEASLLYEQMLSHESSHQFSDAEFDVTSLMSLHSRTPYAVLAAFFSAQNAVNNKNFEAALSKLNWVIEKSKNKDFKQIGKLRKARILLELKKYEEAIKTLEVIEAEAYLPAINEIRGDLFNAMGNKQQARTAYQNALNTLKKDALNRQFLQMKFEQLDG